MEKLKTNESFESFETTLMRVTTPEHYEAVKPYFKFLYKVFGRDYGDWLCKRISFSPVHEDDIVRFDLSSDPTKYRKSEMRTSIIIRKNKVLIEMRVVSYKCTYFSKQHRSESDQLENKVKKFTFNVDASNCQDIDFALIMNKVDSFITEGLKVAHKGSQYVNGK